MQLHDYDVGKSYQAKVIANSRITSPDSNEEVRELILEVDQHAFDFAVGQSIGITVPGVPEIGHDHHFRLYTVADIPQMGPFGNPRVKICVKRCSYIDQYSGEEYKGVASHYLCDRHVGDPLSINGPFGTPFPVPKDKTANLLLIGMGTGIAPFRAFIRHIYEDVGDWKGDIKLFFGANTGLELIYMNDQKNDFTNYYDKETFEAIEALSERGYWGASTTGGDIQRAIESRADDVLDIIKHNGYVYVAGLKQIENALDEVFSKILGSEQQWEEMKSDLITENRWVELIY